MTRAVVVCAVVAFACAPPPPPKDPWQRLQEQQQNGVRLAREGRCREALDELVAVVQVTNAASAWLYIGHCWRQGGRTRDAIRAYGNVLRDPPAGVDRVEIERLVQELERAK